MLIFCSTPPYSRLCQPTFGFRTNLGWSGLEGVWVGWGGIVRTGFLPRCSEARADDGMSTYYLIEGHQMARFGRLEFPGLADQNSGRFMGQRPPRVLLFFGPCQLRFCTVTGRSSSSLPLRTERGG